MRRLQFAVVAVLCLASASVRADPPQVPGQGPDGFRCPAGQESRTPEQVIADRLAALEAGNIDLVMCSYAPDAIVIVPGNVARGKAEIRPAFEFFFGLFGGPPRITSMTVEGETVFVTYAAEGPVASIPDGADTFIIRQGLIRAQTVHGALVFH